MDGALVAAVDSCPDHLVHNKTSLRIIYTTPAILKPHNTFSGNHHKGFYENSPKVFVRHSAGLRAGRP